MKRIGVWHDRLAFLGILGGAGGSRSSGTPDPSELVDSFGKTVRWLGAHAGCDASDRGYLPHEGFPPLPPAFEQYILLCFDESVERIQASVRVAFEDISAVCAAEIGRIQAELHRQLLPTLVTELHVAAISGDLGDGEGTERFRQFVERSLVDPTWVIDYCKTYPVAVRRATEMVRTRASDFAMLLHRIASDFPALKGKGWLAEDTFVAEVSGALGDRHRGGQAVRFVSSNHGTRVVYKPRSVEIDLAFQEVVEWLNERGFEPELHVLPFLSRDDYGWCPFVEPEDCADRAAVDRFYRRHGAHIALLYLLGGRDFFRDNVRTSGEYPVLVDLECVHTPEMPSIGGQLFSSAARRFLEESVARGGLLPSWNWVYWGAPGVNLSALTMGEGQVVPRDGFEWVHLGTDRLRQRRVRQHIEPDVSSMSTLGGIPVPVDGHMHSLLKGFTDAYRIIGDHRDELLAEESVLAPFSRCFARVVLRNTIDYATLSETLRHPRYMVDGARASEFLEGLWASFSLRFPPQVIQAEIDALWEGDIPLFMARGDSRDLYSSDGEVAASQYFEESATAGLRRRLARWGQEDLERQIAIINGAFAITELPHVANRIEVRRRAVHQASHPRIDPGPMLREAEHIADRLIERGFEDAESFSWIGLGANAAGQWDQVPLDSGLYDGAPGIALFLLYLWESSGDERYRRVAEKILRYVSIRAAEEVLRNEHRLEDWVRSAPSGFTFPFSSLYLATHANSLGVESGLSDILDASLLWGREGLRRTPRSDFLSGAAGVVRTLLVAHEALGDDRALNLAARYGDQLVREAVEAESGIAWRSELYPIPLGGFSHGASGIAWILAELAVATGDERYFEAAKAGLDFDRTLFSADRPTWVDRRWAGEEAGTAVQWCHGLAGIGLGRALAWRHTRDEQDLTDARRASAMVLEVDVESDCLCHGSLGNVECCFINAYLLDDDDLKDRASEEAAKVWARARERGHWATGIPRRTVGAPGLMIGIAGVGHALNRLARLTRVPSLLFLEGPRDSSTGAGAMPPAGG